MTTTEHQTSEQASTELDPELAARLERLAARTSVPVRKKRRHPAQGSRVASLILSLATTIGLTTWMAGNANPVLASAGPAVVGSSPTASAGSTAMATPATTATNTLVNGDAFRNRFGTVQVQASFAPDGSLADVTVLQAPSGDRRSAQISSVAIPRLNSEALTAQSANVDTISGATYTSRGYESSLQSAIDAARANAITNIG